MVIKLISSTGSSLKPEAIRILSSDISARLHHTDLIIRHPLAIYNLSLASILSCFESVLSTISSLCKSPSSLTPLAAPHDFEIPLLSKQLSLLYSLETHLDDCERILESCFPSRSAFHNDIQVKAYKSAIHPYRKHVGKVVNHLKHDQGRLRSILFRDNASAHLGYFVEAPDSEGSLGPAPKVHKNGNTAFSFARNLRFHFCNVYLVSAALSRAVINLTKPITLAALGNKDDIGWTSVARSIAALPMVFFSDEIAQSVPTVIVSDSDDGGTTLMLAYPDYETKAETVRKEMEVMINYVGDGVSRSYRMPYADPRTDKSSVKVFQQR